jgi:hypothetical protein
MRMPVRRWPRYGSNTFSTLVLAADKPARRVRHLGGQSRDVVAQQAHCLTDQVAHRLVLGPPIERAVRLGREVGVIAVRRQRDVHVRRALAEQRREIEVGADDVAHGSGRFRRRQLVQRARRRRRHGVFAMSGEHALEEPAQLLARVRPRGSPRLATYACSTARRAGSSARWRRYSIAPTMVGASPGARAFRKRASSSSGLTPSSSLRNILSR